jgi:hypothetical protein
VFLNLVQACITVTTVGYGDISPVTALGRLFTISFLITAVVYTGSLIQSVTELTQIEAQGGCLQRVAEAAGTTHLLPAAWPMVAILHCQQ